MAGSGKVMPSSCSAMVADTGIPAHNWYLTKLLLSAAHYYYITYKDTLTTHVDGWLQHAAPADGGISMEPPEKASNIGVESLLHHYLSCDDHLASQYPAISPGTATARGPSAESEGSPANMSTEEKRGAVSRAFRQTEDPSDLDRT